MIKKASKYIFFVYISLGIIVGSLYLVLPATLSLDAVGCSESFETLRFFQCQNFLYAQILSDGLQYMTLAFLSPLLLLVIAGGNITEPIGSVFLSGVVLFIGWFVVMFLIFTYPISRIMKLVQSCQTRR